MEIIVLSCGQCPLRHQDEFGDFCSHPATPAMDIDNRSIIHPECYMRKNSLTIHIADYAIQVIGIQRGNPG